MEIKRGESVKLILGKLLAAGEIVLTAMEPRGYRKLWRQIPGYGELENPYKKHETKLYNAFYYLKRKGLINIEYRGHQMYFSLTDEGKKKAGKFRLNDLKIKKSKKWDNLWRILIFDIKDNQKIKREALRGKIKELGLYQLQKSVWVYPYDFKKEIAMLREFFGLELSEMAIITALQIENDKPIIEFYGL